MLFRSRTQPHAVDTQLDEVIDVVDDAAQVTDAVAVRVGERTRVHLIDDRFLPPLHADTVGRVRDTRAMGTAPKDATDHTRRANAPVELPFDDADFERAGRGLLATHPTGAIETPFGVVWDTNRWTFIEQGSLNPDTVNPSLWRQAQLNNIHGLFEVAPGVWQARG